MFGSKHHLEDQVSDGPLYRRKVSRDMKDQSSLINTFLKHIGSVLQLLKVLADHLCGEVMARLPCHLLSPCVRGMARLVSPRLHRLDQLPLHFQTLLGVVSKVKILGIELPVSLYLLKFVQAYLSFNNRNR